MNQNHKLFQDQEMNVLLHSVINGILNMVKNNTKKFLRNMYHQENLIVSMKL